MEDLTSDSPLKKEIAIVALRRSVPPDMYQDVITMVVRSDPNPEVRKTALQQVTTFITAQSTVVQAINEAAKDPSRPDEERKIAVSAVQDLGVQSVTLDNSVVLSSSTGSEQSQESSELGGGVFTSFLIKGLLGEASVDGSRSISFSQLAWYVEDRVTRFTSGSQHPVYSTHFASDYDAIIFGSNTQFSNTVVIAIGNSRYINPDCKSIKFANSDAGKFAQVFRNNSAKVYVAENVTKAVFLKTVDGARRAVNDKTLLIFYYAGHSFTDAQGRFWLLLVDADLSNLAATAVSTSEISHTLQSAPAALKVSFMDTGFAGPALVTQR